MRRLIICLVCLLMAATPALAEGTTQAFTAAILESPIFTGEAAEIFADVEGLKEEEGAPTAEAVPFETVSVPSMSEAVMMLTSGRAQCVMVYEVIARYLAARNDALMAGPPLGWWHTMHIIGAADIDMDAVNAALTTLRESGAMDALWQTHVLDVLEAGEPVAVALPRVEGGKTVRVGVSGDLPPIDYITADGKPAGYNTALIAALAEILGWNVEMISMEGAARYAALGASTIDVFFWHQMPVYTDKYSADQVEAVTRLVDADGAFGVSDAYCELEGGMLLGNEWREWIDAQER